MALETHGSLAALHHRPRKHKVPTAPVWTCSLYDHVEIFPGTNNTWHQQARRTNKQTLIIINN